MAKMKTRSARLIIGYNGREISGDMEDFTYTDPAGGASDSISIKLGDRDGKWIDAWMPEKGDIATASILVEDWQKEGDSRNLFTGEFIVDEIGLSGDPVSVSIGAVSKPADDAFSATKRSRTWENVTLREIAQTIAGKYHLALVYDGEDIPIQTKEQDGETDGAFLKSLCESYGLLLKVYRRKLVLYDRERYKEKPAVLTLERLGDVQEWSFERTLDGSYTGGKITYTDPMTEKDVVYTAGMQTRPLELNEKADNAADAERILKAKLADANHGTEKISFRLMGEPRIVSGQVISLEGFGRKISGNYFIDTAEHSVSRSGGYTTRISASRIGTGGSEAERAIDFLASIGIIVTPEYWKENVGKVSHLDLLLCNMAAKIKSNAGGGSITETGEAIAALAEAGIISTPDYWIQHQGELPWLGQLLQNAANAL